jgi:putative two-component system response regulator
LHDLGKLAVSDAVLRKPGKLTAAEFEQIKGHAAAGAAILSGSTSAVLCLAQEIALSHHEWWDGSGYPAGLGGDAIPLSGRIVALADVYDALTHARPYKRAWSAARAAAEIQRLSGRQFDPAVVDAFGSLHPRELVGPLASGEQLREVA